MASTGRCTPSIAPSLVDQAPAVMITVLGGDAPPLGPELVSTGRVGGELEDLGVLAAPDPELGGCRGVALDHPGRLGVAVPRRERRAEQRARLQHRVDLAGLRRGDHAAVAAESVLQPDAGLHRRQLGLGPAQEQVADLAETDVDAEPLGEGLVREQAPQARAGRCSRRRTWPGRRPAASRTTPSRGCPVRARPRR